MRKYLDNKFSVAAKIAGNPFFILLNLFACVALCVGFYGGWLDVAISIWTLILDLILVNQNNRINTSNTDTLDRMVVMENIDLAQQSEHAEQLEWIRAENDTIKKQLALIHNQMGVLIQMATPAKKPGGKDGRFKA